MTTYNPTNAVIDTLAVYRMTRFVTKDTLAEPFRTFVVNRHGEDSKVAYLVHCPWCTSIYLAGVSQLAKHLFPRSWSVIAPAMAMSAAASLIQTKVE